MPNDGHCPLLKVFLGSSCVLLGLRTLNSRQRRQFKPDFQWRHLAYNHRWGFNTCERLLCGLCHF